MVFQTQKLFCTEDVVLYPKEIEAYADLKKDAIEDAEIDVIITAHDLPHMTNLTVENYLLHERTLKIHIIVVESSTKDSVFEKLYQHPRVSRVLLKKDVLIKGKVHGYGSYGLALSAAVGVNLSRAPYVFFSHPDMIACKDGFLNFLKSKLVGNTRIAGFTQRHAIPLMGTMMVAREVLKNPKLDMLPRDTNPLLEAAGLSEVAQTVYHLNHTDCGEQYIYDELAKHNPVYICASRGGSEDWWKHPLGYYEGSSSDELLEAVAKSKSSLVYAPLKCEKAHFEKKHKDLIKAGHEGFWLFEKPKWWRYSFDDQGDLIFVHHGRGTTLKAVKRWLSYLRNYNEALAQRVSAN